MSRRRGVPAKISTEGVPACRGVRGKTSKEDTGQTAEASNCRLLLKKKLMKNRMKLGLGELVEENVNKKYELTAEEVEKKERRKEQNRRAARKCRQKKKMLQSVVNEDYSKMREENAQMEQEIRLLRAKKEHLLEIINEHMGSEQCRQVKVECTFEVPLPAVEQQVDIDSDVYLKDLGPLSPRDTFQNLEDLDADQNQYGRLEELESPVPHCAISEDHYSRSVQPENDQMETLKALMPAQTSCPFLLSPFSPVTDNSRQSASSFASASDWSPCSSSSDNSQGFSVRSQDSVPMQSELTPDREVHYSSFSSETEPAMDLSSCVSNDDDDDVFSL